MTMRCAFLRLIALLAVVLMPLGMSAAPAAPLHAHPAMMPMNHCSDKDSSCHGSGPLADCTMACSSALPAQDLPSESPPLAVFVPVFPILAQTLHGLDPDTATPPPKLP
jgi:hypothetical protein